jgi:hypothetical protein
MTRAPRLCDFCNKELRLGSAWAFPCRDHETQPIPGMRPRVASQGHWDACGECARLIKAGRRDKLARRAARTAPPGIPRDKWLAVMRKVHDDFWSNRSGPPSRITREDWDRGVEPPIIEER